MSLADYEAYVTSSMFLDQPDPVAAWQELGRRQAGPVAYMTGRQELIRIEADADRPDLVGRGTDLDQLGWPAKHAFRRDLHGADRNECLGAACAAGSRCAGGRELCRDCSGICRREGGLSPSRSGGRLPAFDARPRPGASAIRELGLGLNPGIDRFTGSILYDEKIGGTVHLALGQSYPETGEPMNRPSTGT